MTTSQCQQFLDHLDDLALGSLDEPERTELLQHAADCSLCRARLDQLTWVTEQVLVTVPEIEPPAGFEDRVLARLDPSNSVNRGSKGVPWRWIAAAALIIAFAAGGFALGHRGQDPAISTAGSVRSGSITRVDGSTSGTAVLASAPRPHVLITLNNPRPSTESVHCVLVRPDGQRIDVGSWSYLDIERGAWAVGIDPSLLSATRMDIVDSHGVVLASARLS